MDAQEAVQAWKTVVGAARVEPMTSVHNPIWKVTGEDGREWVLKQLPEWPPGAEPVQEYRVLCHLQARGLPVATPVVTDDGLIAHNADNLGCDPDQKKPTGAYAYALLPLLPNDSQLHESPELARVIGRGIGRLDRILADCPWRVSSYTHDPAQEILGATYTELPDDVRSLIDPLGERLWAAVTDLPAQLTHGDCNVGNVLVHHGAVTGYLDLDHLPYGPRVRDLSYYLASRLVRHALSGDAQAMVSVLGEYVAGYHSVQPVTRRELKAVVPLLLIALVGGAAWCLHGWTPDPAGYQRHLQALQWTAPRYGELVDAAAM